MSDRAEAERLMADYGLLLGAYLAMETALAKRVLKDWQNDRGDWPGKQEWDGLGQTSHETFWQLARLEAGLPREPSFKDRLIAAGS